MNSRVAISLGLSIVVHGLIFWKLIITFPEARTLLTEKSSALIVDIVTPKVGLQSYNVILPDENAERTTSQIAEYSSKFANQNENLLVDNTLDDVSVSIPEPKYYPLAELDHAPVILENINTNPPELLNHPEGGQLIIRLWLDEEGGVVEAELVKSQLPKEFVESSLKSFRQTKFSPGLKANLPVRSVVNIVVNYSATSQGSD